MHLTEEQLNEYLDNESVARAQIESHLDSCADCAARLTALRILFAELDSLPELTISTDLAARFIPQGQPTPQLPRWLTLTAALQAAFALIALVLAAPFVSTLIPAIESPSLTEVFLQLRSQWLTLFNTFTNFQFPALPQLPPLEISNLMLSVTLAGASLLWMVGNGLLLRKQIK